MKYILKAILCGLVLVGFQARGMESVLTLVPANQAQPTQYAQECKIFNDTHPEYFARTLSAQASRFPQLMNICKQDGLQEVVAQVQIPKNSLIIDFKGIGNEVLITEVFQIPNAPCVIHHFEFGLFIQHQKIVVPFGTTATIAEKNKIKLQPTSGNAELDTISVDLLNTAYGQTLDFRQIVSQQQNSKENPPKQTTKSTGKQEKKTPKISNLSTYRWLFGFFGVTTVATIAGITAYVIYNKQQKNKEQELQKILEDGGIVYE